MAAGGDGLGVFTQVSDPIIGAIDLDAFAAYFMASSPISPPPSRITRLD